MEKNIWGWWICLGLVSSLKTNILVFCLICGHGEGQDLLSGYDKTFELENSKLYWNYYWNNSECDQYLRIMSC
jgi:hypothetical protein